MFKFSDQFKFTLLEVTKTNNTHTGTTTAKLDSYSSYY